MASGRLRLHRQAAQRGQDPHAIGLPIAMRIFLELRVAGPVPGILNGPSVAHVL